MPARKTQLRLVLRRQACGCCRIEGHNRRTCMRRASAQTWIDFDARP